MGVSPNILQLVEPLLHHPAADAARLQSACLADTAVSTGEEMLPGYCLPMLLLLALLLPPPPPADDAPAGQHSSTKFCPHAVADLIIRTGCN
jgi:hypothetical protein